MRRLLQASSVLLLAVSPGLLAQRGAGDERASLVQSIDAKRDSYATVAKQIWGFAEVGYQEAKSSALLQQQLRAAGFQVKAGVADIPTAFVATFGSGKPVIGIVGEFDALPGLSQEAQTAARHAIEENAAGARLRPQPARHRRAGGGGRRQGVAGRDGTDGHASLLRDAGRRRRLGQGVHGSRRPLQRRRRRGVVASGRPQRGESDELHRQHHRRSSAFTASRRMRRRRPTADARRSTPSKRWTTW